MKTDKKLVQGKNGLRNYHFEEVKKGKIINHYDPNFGHYTEVWKSFFYKKKCLYCSNEFEGKRLDATFCSQSCQKAHKRLRKNIDIS
ncbi:hypothetical protein [Spirosoma radiotolerans]|uniref:Uncharacterized protein n=1 Tax=Spirosoma radiotolerans TaxID=1379870 RepID=A0A0E3ZXK3_9BACT|nr:hypothetical protein [Spirosoma radiotolerans]AKD56978.1 hypothetical protein SD10_20805 [Spirosoma radiotolerans]